jgi:peptide/nickel transport system substrate-binding protein
MQFKKGSKRQIALRLALLLVSASILGACTPSTIVETQVVTVVETQVVEVEVEVPVEVTSAPATASNEGGTLIFGTNLAAEFPINPVLSTHRPAMWLFDSLVDLDAATTQPIGNLAESWDVSADGMVYTFHLRDDVKWHDGEDFDADDVIFTMDAFMNDPDSRLASAFVFSVDGESVPMVVTKIDDYTVEMALPTPSSLFLNNLCCWNGMLPEHLLSGFEKMADATEFNENPIGTGVLIFEELRTLEFVRFSMNKDYWRGRPALDAFIWLVLPDDDSQITALSNGEIDIMKNVNSVDVASRISEIPGVTIYTTLGNFTHALFFNPETYPLFQDIRIRDAVAMAIDKPTIMANVVGAPHAEQVFNPGYWGYNPDARVLSYDPEGALALLADAGWTDSDGDGILDQGGETLSFTVMIERLIPGEAIQGYLQAIGIDMQIVVVERAIRREIQGTGEWDAYIGWDGSGVPFSALNSNWISDTWSNYDNPDFDALVIAADAATDDAERAGLVQEAIGILNNDTAAVWLYYFTSRIAVSDNVKGLLVPGSTADLNNTGVLYHLEDLYMVDPK